MLELDKENKMIKIFIYVISSIMLLQFCTCNKNEWVVYKSEYQGYPLFIRYKDGINKAKYNKIIMIKLKLEKVKQNGLPENDYNLSLFDFDSSLTNQIIKQDSKMPFLIETFGGRRNFYLFTNNDTALIESYNIIKKKFNNLDLTMTNSNKNAKEFIESYFKEVNIKR